MRATHHTLVDCGVCDGHGGRDDRACPVCHGSGQIEGCGACGEDVDACECERLELDSEAERWSPPEIEEPEAQVVTLGQWLWRSLVERRKTGTGR